jgi:NhaP-type Na+/H+ and K+/H+ antiporter
MDQFLWLGTILGVILGALHATLVFRNRLADEGASPIRAAYFGVWAFALWSLSGPYLLAFYLAGAAGMAVSHLARSTMPKS